MQTTQQPPLTWILGAAFIQGLLLFLLYHSLKTASWPATDSTWLTPLFTATVFIPLLFQLSVTPTNLVRLAKFISILMAFIVPVAFYVGYMIHPTQQGANGSIAGWYAISILVAVFKGAMYIQQRANQQTLTYPLLFTYSWRNFLTVVLGVAFTGAVTLVLYLWSSLFKVIGIEFFDDLFWNDWFIIPVLSIAFGGAISIFRKLQHVIDSITHLLEGLIRLLLPLICVLAIIFLSTMPFVGLTPLWDTGNGTALLLTLVALTLFFTNAVYQGGDRDNLYPAPVRWLICLGLLTLPVFSALSFYGLWLRVDEYGWTVERCWAMVVWLVLFIFASGYAIGVIKAQLNWPTILAKTNMYLGLFVLALMLVANSPILDFRKISLSSQINRVEAGDQSWMEFDFYYAKRHLGRPAHNFIEQLKIDHQDNEDLLALIENPLPAWARQKHGINPIKNIVFNGPEFEIPEAVKKNLRDLGFYFNQVDLLALTVDLNRDALDDIVFVSYDEQNIHQAFAAIQKGNAKQDEVEWEFVY